MTPEIQKQVILTMYQEGHPYAEIANSLLLSPNTVKSICYRSGLKPVIYEKLNQHICKNCGKPLRQTQGGRKKVFCSDKCRYNWWNRKRGRQPYRLICSQCGREFISLGNRKRKFCGRECYLLSRYREGDGVP